MADESRQLKITNPQRIIRIFSKICQSRLHVFLRASPSSSVVVKGRAMDLIQFEPEKGAQIPAFSVGELSEKGTKYLFDKDFMQIEFVMTSTKVVCTGEILRIRKGHVVFSLPVSMTSVERRENARYKTSERISGFVGLSVWQPGLDDHLSGPVFAHHRQFANLLPLADLGMGGFCLRSMFPAPLKYIQKGETDSRAVFHLPMAPPFSLPVQFRWIKHIKEHQEAGGNWVQPLRYHLFGCKFMAVSPEARLHFKRFIQQLIESEAI